ncbi:MAG: acyltransferase family protein [Lachnospiraceae bacterium]|nr:acyltransferase family protein [Lachnospiraceae bacterium]
MSNIPSVDRKRDCRIDNIKGLLILCVVIGHLLELRLKVDSNRYLHVLIYLFHMPAFIFVTGYFAHFSMKKTVVSMVYPYLLFQFIYLLFAREVLHLKAAYQITTPYWIMWYLLAISVWSLSLYFFRAESRLAMLIEVGMLVGIALMVGTIPGFSRFLSLSRIIVFFPFYMAGYYMRQYKNRDKSQDKSLNRSQDKSLNRSQDRSQDKSLNRGQDRSQDKSECRSLNRRWNRNHVCVVIASVLVLATLYYCSISYGFVDRNWLYEATGYAKSHYGMAFRGTHMLLAFACIFALFTLMPECKIPVISKAGGKTLSIYLLHGFFVKVIGKYGLLKPLGRLPEMVETSIIVVMALVIVVALSTKPVTDLLDIILMRRKKKD